MNATYAPLCRYHYDPLDRLATCSPGEQNGIQRFYQKNRLTTEIQGQIQRALFQTEDQLLAQHEGPNSGILLASDQQRSVLEGLDASQRQSVSYTPYGVRHPQTSPFELLGYTGERADPVTGHYLLGNGYRAYNPVLMRFNSPDSLSPFGEGVLNAYAYCVGDPVNRVDPTGHFGVRHLIKLLNVGNRPKLMGKLFTKAKRSLTIQNENKVFSTANIPHPLQKGNKDRAFERVKNNIARNSSSKSISTSSTMSELSATTGPPPIPPRASHKPLPDITQKATSDVHDYVLGPTTGDYNQLSTKRLAELTEPKDFRASVFDWLSSQDSFRTSIADRLRERRQIHRNKIAEKIKQIRFNNSR